MLTAALIIKRLIANAATGHVLTALVKQMTLPGSVIVSIAQIAARA